MGNRDPYSDPGNPLLLTEPPTPTPPPATGGTGWLPPYRLAALPPFAAAFK